MLFSYMIFLWVFLPLVLIGNGILSRLPLKEDRRIRAKNIFLLVASLVFYAWGGIYYLLIMLFSILINFFGGRMIGKRLRRRSEQKKCLLLVIALNLAMLFVFKYFNMLVVVIENVIDPRGGGSILGMQGTGILNLPQIVLPIGISFFTFQAMSYVIDVYRKDVPVQESLASFALYVSFFPQLIAGPIVRYHEVADQIGYREEKLAMRAYGIKRFCYGIGKKVLLANTFAAVADDIWALGNGQITGLTAWLGMLSYTLQIYYDFSGYSDMAIGLGRMFGFRFAENFNYPYVSASVQEFWRRWHISLSTWFKEYVYIPLGGNRKGKGRTLLNLFIVFLLTGIWHGANFTFIAWGLFYAVLLILERLFLGDLLKRNPLKWINHIYTLFAVMVAWVLFRSDTIFQAGSILKGLFDFSGNQFGILSFLSMKLILFLIIGILLCGPVQMKFAGWYKRARRKAWVRNADFAIQMILLVLSILSLVGGTYNPFIYFQF